MRASQGAINLIKTYESCKLTAYQDSAGNWTIGYGHKGNCTKGTKITQQQALDYLKADLAIVEKAINAKGYKLTQNQFDALLSLFYNLGTGKIAKFHPLLKANPNSEAVADKMMQYVYAGGRRLSGLVDRRESEAYLYES